MPNLTTGFPKRTGNMEKDYGNIYNWSISLVDELKYILCNLDAGNVTEANSVKAHHIDCSQARIKGAQIQSLTADKLTAGTIDAKEIIVKNIDADNINTGTLNSGLVNIENSDSLGKVTLDGDSLIFYEKIDGELYPRIALGRDEDGKYIFTVQNISAAKGLTVDENGNTAQGIYMDDEGNIVITGLFSTGTEGQARTVIDGNGIQSYDADGNRSGLWCNEPNSDSRRFADLTLYYLGEIVFQIYNSIDGISFRDRNDFFLSRKNGIANGKGKWTFEQGASGSFQTADGKTVTVSGGLITGIS